MPGDFSGEVAAFYVRHRRGYPPGFVGMLARALQLGPDDVAADVGCGTGQLTIPLESRCGTDPASRQRYQAALGEAGFTGICEESVDYTSDLSFEEVIGGLYSAMPRRMLPPPGQRAAFTRHIRNAIGPGPRFTEAVHVTALIGHTPA